MMDNDSSLLPHLLEQSTKLALHYTQADVIKQQITDLQNNPSIAAAFARLTYVGAVSEQAHHDKPDTGQPMLCENDSMSLAYTLQAAQQLNIRLSANFSATYLTLRDDKALLRAANTHKADFLFTPVPTDILVIGYIPYAYDNASPHSSVYGFKVSHDHFVQDAWLRAAQRSGAKMIVTFGGPREINATHFLPSCSDEPPYIAITEQLTFPRHHHGTRNCINVLIARNISHSLSRTK